MADLKSSKFIDISLHPTDSGLAITYSIDGQRKTKLVRVNITSNSEVPAYAEKVLNQYAVVPSSMFEKIKSLLYELLQRAESSSHQEDRAMLQKTDQRRWEREQEQPKVTISQPEEAADIEKLEDYITFLYEDLPSKIKSTKLLLLLARNPQTLQILANKENLMQALPRVLHEDYKKSADLSYNILQIFLCFSNYSQFQGFVKQKQIGIRAMDIMELERTRYAAWNNQVAKQQDIVDKDPRNASAKQELDRMDKSMKVKEKLQEKVLYTCAHLLLNLSEDVTFEVQLVNRNLVEILADCLKRSNPELLLTCVLFLKKLSIYKENKDDMIKSQVVKEVVKFLIPESSTLVNATLRLLLNLSHDSKLRHNMVALGVVSRLIELFRKRIHTAITISLLYQLSIDNAAKERFKDLDTVPAVTKLIIDFKGDRVGKELIALGINLSANADLAASMCANNGLNLLVKRVIARKDPLLMKMIRNISQHTRLKEQFRDHIEDLVKFMRNVSSNDLLVEILGTFGNLNLEKYDYAKLVSSYSLLNYLIQILSSPVEDDIILEAIIFVGTMSADINAASMIVSSGVVHKIIEILSQKNDDDEIVLQSLYACYNLLRNPDALKSLVDTTPIVDYLVRLLSDKNREIRKLCDACLDIISEIDKSWALKIRRLKFQNHNAVWLSDVNAQLDDTDDVEDDQFPDDDGEEDLSTLIPFQEEIPIETKKKTKVTISNEPSSSKVMRPKSAGVRQSALKSSEKGKSTAAEVDEDLL